VCALRTTVVHNTAQYSSEYFPSYLLDNYLSSQLRWCLQKGRGDETYTTVFQKDTKLVAIMPSNLNPFLNSFTLSPSSKYIRSEAIIKDPTVLHTCHYTTLRNINVRKKQRQSETGNAINDKSQCILELRNLMVMHTFCHSSESCVPRYISGIASW